MITIDEFKAAEIRIGEIINAEKVEGLDKILKLTVSFGNYEITKEDGSVETQEEIRTILSGIALTFTDEKSLIGKQCPFVTNLEPRTIKGHISQGMIMAMGSPENVTLLHPSSMVPPGTHVN
jgi:methionine--tRNA ligase beta chain